MDFLIIPLCIVGLICLKLYEKYDDAKTQKIVDENRKHLHEQLEKIERRRIEAAREYNDMYKK